MISSCATAGIKDPAKATTKLRPWKTGFRRAGFEKLGELCFPIFEADIARNVVLSLTRQGGLIALMESEEKQSYMWVVMRPDSLFWIPPLQTNLYDTLNSAAENSIVHESCHELFRRIGDEFFQKPGIGKAFINANKEGLELLWSAIMSKTLQYRVRKDLLETRNVVIKAGLSEEKLPIPEWLKPEPEPTPARDPS